MTEKAQAQKILMINPFGIGDVLFTTPIIEALKKAYPKSTIMYWCNERVVDLFKNNPHLCGLFALSRGDLKRIFRISKIEGARKFLKLFFDLKKEKFDISIDFSLDHRYGLLSKAAGIKRRIGFNYKNRGRFLTDRIDIEGYTSKHVVEYYLDLLKLLQIKPYGNTLNLTVPQSSKLKSRIQLDTLGVKEGQLLIGIAPGAGASWGKNALRKHWPTIRFTQLADRLISQRKAKVLILGNESEREIADAMVYSMKHKPLDLVGKTTLEELIALISNLDILVANDGGPLHIAVALGVKSVSIFGPVDPLVYGPYPLGNKHVVVRSALECSPCYQNFRLKECTQERQCLDAITVEQVYEAVGGLCEQ